MCTHMKQDTHVVQYATRTPHTRTSVRRVIVVGDYPLTAPSSPHYSHRHAHACSLYSNQIGDAGAVALGEGLKPNTALTIM